MAFWFTKSNPRLTVGSPHVSGARNSWACARVSGRKTRNATWFRPGVYRGMVTLQRNGDVISDIATSVIVR